ncbi:argininosuccinate lyase [Eggerthella sp. NSJ-70]|uniref:Argininosuccinate lyase n=1 Tax=Eggerthella hominis TaxID=2763043 RepID=A0ABR7BX61_9ACTN|nr:argininosuccinate lyase [Eggerthella hominis]MBC5585690.1 argininosuccinate lyase [Eggerthella hominis]
MPALQVRDFPDELYEQLKAYAASQHRSVAQQTIVAVEQMLEAADAQHYWDGRELHRLERRPRYLDFDTETERAARIEKRKALFAEIRRFEWSGPKQTADEIVEFVHEGRRERDRQMSDVLGLPYDEEV